MSGFNMPPGVNPEDIPGNRPTDKDIDDHFNTTSFAIFFEIIEQDLYEKMLDGNEAIAIWKTGLAAYDILVPKED